LLVKGEVVVVRKTRRGIHGVEATKQHIHAVDLPTAAQ
jgi:hypothetical protein